MLRDLGATNIHLSASRDFISCDLPTPIAQHFIDDLSKAHTLYHAVSASHHHAISHIQHVWRRPIPTHESSKKHHHTKKHHYIGMHEYQMKLDKINALMATGQHHMAHQLLRGMYVLMRWCWMHAYVVLHVPMLLMLMHTCLAR